MNESELLAHIYARSAGLVEAFSHVLVGPGDDCAVIEAPGGAALLLKVDQVVAGRHFRHGTPIDLVARKAVARAISDVAAMGGTPLAALAGAVLPPDYGTAEALFDALQRWAARWGCPIVGGDTAAAAGAGAAEPDAGLVLAITIVGRPHAQRGPVLRSGARPGDALYVTGRLGGSLDRATGLGRHLTFEPRLAEARWLGDTLGEHLHAMMDISDGLGLDAARMARASGVRIELDADRLPLHEGVPDWRAAAGDGEDYELLFAVAPDAALAPACPSTGTPVTSIGRVLADGGGATCVALTPDGAVDVSTLGWEHGRA